MNVKLVGAFCKGLKIAALAAGGHTATPGSFIQVGRMEGEEHTIGRL